MSRLFVGASFYIQLPFLLLLYSMAFAGKLSPVMEQVLSQAPPDSEITVLARPALEVEIYALKRELESIRASRAERHRRVMTGLKRRSAAAQAGLLSELEAERTAGRVREYKPFWITNLVAVTASVQAVRKLASSKEVGEILENKAIQFLCEKKRKDSANSSSGRMSPETASTFKKFNWSLRQINAHKLWEKGLTGKGVLVANIDTGVDCNHPALKDKWRGANGALASECWFDAVGDRSIPMEMNILGMDSTRHGTGTMSQIVGQDGADTIGVAPDAQWIAAGFLSGGNDKKAAVLESFEWMADPDGDPETIDDVPDILSNSWAVYPLEACPTIYDEAINNLKALGVTPVFAAGNEGEEGSMSLVGPASNPKFFAVGATDKNNVVAKWSSKGPSPCDRQIIKPDVVAPGVDLLTAQPLHSGGGYIVASGTSGAAPLVAGIAALLKQYNPELTPDEITEAIRNSATDLGPSGPDNEYGWGLVNAEAALSLVEPAESPHFTITKIEVIPDFEDLVYPGEKARVILRLVNLGAEAGAVTAELSSKSPDVMVESAAASFGNLTTGSESSNSWAPFVLSFSPQMPENVTRTFNLQVFAGSLARMLSFSLKIGQEQEPPKKGYTTNAIGKAALSLTNYGVIGTGSAEGGGFKYPYAGAASPDHLYLGALLLATGPTTLSDADFNETTRGIFVGFDRDFSPVHGGNLKVQSPGSFADLEVTGIFSDNEAADPLGVRIYQRSYAWSAEADDDYVIVQYALRIPYGSESLAGVYVAQHLDWDVGGGEDSGEDDLVGFDSGLRLAYMYDNVSNVYVGHALLTHQVAGFRAINYDRDISDGFTGAEKFSFMTSGIGDTLILTPDDWSELLSTGPFYLKSDKETVVAFAIVGGMSLEELRANTRAAITRYKEIFPEEPEEPVASCDINGDGRNNILDVISLLLLLRDKPGDMAGDFNADGIADIFDAIALLVALRDGACPEAGVLMSSANNYTLINMVEGLTRENAEYLRSVMAQLDLRAGEKEAFQAILSSYGKTCEAGLPEKLSLSRNVPNPFNPSTSIIYTVPEGPVVQITLRIYSIRGQLVCTLVDKTCEAGSYNVFWDGTDGVGHHVSSGVYFYRMQAGDFIQTRKMVLLK